MIQYQILQTYIIRMVWQTVRRITKEILGVNAFVSFSNKQVMIRKLRVDLQKKKINNFKNHESLNRLPCFSAIKKILTSFSGLNNLQISELKNVEEEKLSSENITFHLLIKTITKFLNMIGYLQPNLSTYSTVYVSCL